ncbi:hypothetical protein [Chengkuizengella axinellae]|uniref:Spo0E family sporulation regulatory protein-aspartic acid phosphatase n=1 Tax=Chengkuizengella axinellae TaxID=3064388 RepID=A0ABT9J0H9_9BACL|nr:hypothetical protein [Chengkuizengella sp. 2205SS18-9]MDP5275131.1 hypothetical protein [Chengkuizengella sp. 2205SS18-9]
MNKLQNNYKDHYVDCLILTRKVDELINRVLELQLKLKQSSV